MTHDLSRIYRFDPSHRDTTGSGRLQGTDWRFGLDNRTVEILVTASEMQGQACSPSITSCNIKSVAVDDHRRRIYFSFQRGSETREIHSADWSGEDRRMLYSGLVYEQRSSKGPMYFAGMGVDTAYDQLYVSVYRDSSLKRSYVSVPLPESPHWPGDYETEACLYGHKSILHARGNNLEC